MLNVPGQIHRFGPELGFERSVDAINLAALSAEQRSKQFSVVPSEVIINPEVTTAIVIGQMEKRPSFVDVISPPMQVSKKEFKYPTWPDKKWMERKNTKRGPSAPYGMSHTVPSSVSGALVRHSWGTYADQSVLNNADSAYQIGVVYSGFAERIVRKNREYAMADVLLDVTPGNTYHTDHITTLLSTDEFNGASPALTPRAVVEALVLKICQKTGCEPSDLRIYGSLVTLNALYASTDFQTWNRGQVARMGDPGVAEGEVIARYFGVGGALFENAVGLAADGTFGPIFDDKLIVYLPGAGGNYDTMFGDRRFFAHWRMNAGIASDPWFDRTRSSWVYPWDEEYLLDLLDIEAAALVVNTAA